MIVVYIVAFLIIIYGIISIGLEKGYQKERNKELSEFFPAPPSKKKG